MIPFFVFQSHSQILISLIFGDKLNSDKLEFGLDGGINLSQISNIEESKSLNKLNLGFYFDVKMTEQLFLRTGLQVVSPMGARNINPYFINDSSIDSILINSKVTRGLDYFNVPIMLKYKFHSHFYVEGGTMLGLLHTATDTFTDQINGDDVFLNRDVRDLYNRIDVGVMGGLGYRLLGGNGMNLGVRYYYGLRNILKDESLPKQVNSSLYAYVGIPIGAGKAKEKDQ